LNEDSAKAWIHAALRRHEKPLLRVAGAICGPTLAPDVVQDTFLRLCAQPEEEVRGHLAAWLFTVCRNRAVELTRKQGRAAELPDDIVLPSAGLQQVTAEREQLLRHALEAMEGLPAQRREVVLLKFSGELSYREIAEVTGLSLSHVGVILHEALKQVRVQLRKKGVLDCDTDPRVGEPREQAAVRSAL
jgi:RNA polymerase sigma-70 factor (ECF subfamily)